MLFAVSSAFITGRIGFGRAILAHVPRPHERQPLEYGSVQVRVGIVAYPLGPGCHGSILASDHRVRRPCWHGRWWSTLSHVQPRHSDATRDAGVPSTDNDPLYRFQQWLGNLRVLGVTETKTMPYAPLSHPFVEQLIGTLRRERLDRTLFWTTADLEAKLLDFQHYYNEHRRHTGRKGHPRATSVNADHSMANLGCYRWQKHCRGLYQTLMAA